MHTPVAQPNAILNSVVDNPEHGDERNFMRIRKFDSNAEWADRAELERGAVYEVSVYYRNDSLKEANFSRLRVEIPAIVRAEPSDAGDFALAYIRASNALPSEVVDSVRFDNYTTADVALRRKSGTAQLKTSGRSAPIPVSDDVFGDSGILLGDTQRDGLLRSGESGHLTFQIVADQPQFYFSTEVRPVGDKELKSEIVVENGALIQLVLAYNNVGTTEQRDVVLKAEWPSLLRYQPGKSIVKNASNKNGATIGDGIAGDGVNIGHYSPDSNAYLIAEAIVVGDPCQKADLRAAVETINGSRIDSVSVTVAGVNCS